MQMCFIYKHSTYIQLFNDQQFSITFSLPFFMSDSILLYLHTALYYTSILFHMCFLYTLAILDTQFL